MFSSARMAPPGGEFPLGADRYGRDTLSRIAYGTRISFKAGVLSVLVASVVGSTLDLLAGYFRGAVDAILMRVM